MENVQCASIARTALEYLGVQYRPILLPHGCLCFCTMTGGLTFNLFMGSEGQVSLWRFVGTASLNSAGGRLEFCRSVAQQSMAGLEVTEEGEVRLYAQQVICDSKTKESRIVKIICEFCALMSDINVCLFSSKPGSTLGGEDK